MSGEEFINKYKDYFSYEKDFQMFLKDVHLLCDKDFIIKLNTEDKVIINNNTYLFQNRSDIYEDKTQQPCYYCDLLPYNNDDECQFKCSHFKRLDEKDGIFKLKNVVIFTKVSHEELENKRNHNIKQIL